MLLAGQPNQHGGIILIKSIKLMNSWFIIRLYYSTKATSAHQVNLADLNHNKIPDYIENIAIQLQATREAFKLAGFRHPLHSSRYQSHTRNISIFIKDMKGNGLAFEVTSQYPLLATEDKMPCSLIIYVSNQLKNFPGDDWTRLTHELFHLYQYSYSQFKNAWYLESLANWAERALRSDLNTQTRQLKPLPQNLDQLQQDILKQAYHGLWRRQFLIDQKEVWTLPDYLSQMRYSNGNHVFKDKLWYGSKFVKGFLENLEQQSNQISKQRGWHP